MKRVLFVTSEAVPFIKTGGLADVAGSLPKYFSKNEYEVSVMLPKYMCIREDMRKKMHHILHFYVDLGWRKQYVGILEAKEDGIQYYFIDNEFYFAGERPYNNIYEDVEKFAFFSKAALMHHERCDGSGYPMGLTMEEIDDYALIIAIADVYDAMTAARSYRAPLCPFEVIAEFEKDGLQKYKPKYILTFLENIANAYQNNRVMLSDGTSARIVLLNHRRLSKPLVQLDDGACIDLEKSPLYIKAII